MIGREAPWARIDVVSLRSVGAGRVPVASRDLHGYRHSSPCQVEVHAKGLKGLPLLDEAPHLSHVPLNFIAGVRVDLSLRDVLHDCLLDRIWAAFAFDARLELRVQDADHL